MAFWSIVLHISHGPSQSLAWPRPLSGLLESCEANTSMQSKIHQSPAPQSPRVKIELLPAPLVNSNITGRSALLSLLYSLFKPPPAKRWATTILLSQTMPSMNGDDRSYRRAKTPQCLHRHGAQLRKRLILNALLHQSCPPHIWQVVTVSCRSLSHSFYEWLARIISCNTTHARESCVHPRHMYRRLLSLMCQSADLSNQDSSL
ncbi:hypothetical protein BD289DRAFT_139748 [Coniella lustricola]|uniref:Uncharacterized protein n=1 Tax=Coniella lustricola TaxID=2025994 RepID=A0A2T3AF36_9PEZI|nr:hypothetical protein BD289DRAFT_139748 [Coniella lustricola]